MYRNQRNRPHARLNQRSNVNMPVIILVGGALLTIGFTVDSVLQQNSIFVTLMILLAFSIGTFFAYRYATKQTEFGDKVSQIGVWKSIWQTLFHTKATNNMSTRRRRNIRRNRY